MRKSIIIIAALGKFYGAGKRISVELNGLDNDVQVEIVDEKLLNIIASNHGIDKSRFTKNIRGFGYWQWKPLIIYHYLNSSPIIYDNVIYVDAGCEVEQSSFNDLLNWFNKSRYNLVVGKTGHNISNYTKPSVIDQMSGLELDLDNTEMLQATLILTKRGTKIVEVFERMSHYVKCEKEELFNDELIEPLDCLDSFIDHRHDQSVLTLEILKSKHIHEIGVLPSSLTPPDHNSWISVPPVIAARNHTCVNLYWPIMFYNSSNLPNQLKISIKMMHMIARIFDFNELLLKLYKYIMKKRYYRDISIISKYNNIKILNAHITYEKPTT